MKENQTENRFDDKEIIRITSEFRTGMIGKKGSSTGWCSKICWPLLSYFSVMGVEMTLKRGKVRARIGLTSSVKRYDHVWLELEDGRILDPTYDQFQQISEAQIPVYLGKLPTNYSSKY